MKRLSFPLAILATLSIVGTALAAPALSEFGSAPVDVTGRDSFTITTVQTGVDENGNPVYNYGGVYVRAKSLANRPLADAQISFVSTGDVSGGAPRFSIPISTDGNTKTTELYAFLAGDRCGGTSDVSVTVSTENTACVVDLNTGGTYANWDALAAANPTWVISRAAPFIVVDGAAGTYAVEDIDLQ